METLIPAKSSSHPDDLYRIKNPKERVLAVESGDLRRSSENAGIFVEHVEWGKDEEEAYEEAWQIVNERALRGWKLRGMKEAPAGGGVELTWYAPDHRQG